MLLRVDAINVFYGEIQVLHDVSLAVNEGEIVCLLGGNASGKSTTMKSILGLVQPRSGSIYFDGERIDTLRTPERIRRGIASVPEARRLFPEMTVRENLLLGAFLRRDAAAVNEDLDRMLDLFPRLGERLSQTAGTLSGGEQQMVAMARALMSRPRLLCMDEPSMGLSPRFVDRVFELIQQVNAQGVTLFMVEQNARMALEVASRGYLLQNGRLVLEGPARDLLHNPTIQSAYLGEAVTTVPTPAPET